MPVILLIKPAGFAKNASPAKAPLKPAIPCNRSIIVLSSPNVLSQFSVIQFFSLVNVFTSISQKSLIFVKVSSNRFLLAGSLIQSRALYIIRPLKNFIKFPKNPNPPPTIFATILSSPLPSSSASNFFSLARSDANAAALFAFFACCLF